MDTQTKRDESYDELLNPFARPRSSVQFSDELKAKLKQMGLTGETSQPITVKFDDICAASFRIRKGIGKTPCEKCPIPELSGVELYLKKEYLHPTGSFKERGAINCLLLLSEAQKEYGVITASAGNHAMALAYHGHALGVPVHVIMPEHSPVIKQTMCKKFGAKVILKGNNQWDAKQFAIGMAKEEGLAFINGFDHPHVISGQGTMGLEIIDQVNNLDAIVLPVGGGGLLAGVALAVKKIYPNIQIIGVESESCASFSAAMDAGKPVKTVVNFPTTLADALCIPKVGTNAFHIAKGLVDKMVKISEDSIGLAVLRLLESEGAVIEGSGAAAVAALLGGYLPELDGKRVAVPLCGGNIDPAILGRCIERGLASDGRLVRFVVTLDERPGGLARLVSQLASVGANIREMSQDREWLNTSIFTLQCKVVVELRDSSHAQSVKETLQKQYSDVMWNVRYAADHTIYDNLV